MENKNEQEMIKMEEMTENPSKCEVLGAVIAFRVIGFWFGIGAILAVKVVRSLDDCIESL